MCQQKEGATTGPAAKKNIFHFNLIFYRLYFFDPNFCIFASSKWTLNNSKKTMKTSIFAMMIAAAMVVASCGQKKTEEESSEPIETIIEETPAVEEVPSEELIEGEIEDSTVVEPAAEAVN
nr:hypothetical protein [Cytophagales bacterium]